MGWLEKGKANHRQENFCMMQPTIQSRIGKNTEPSCRRLEEQVLLPRDMISPTQKMEGLSMKRPQPIGLETSLADP